MIAVGTSLPDFLMVSQHRAGLLVTAEKSLSVAVEAGRAFWQSSSRLYRIACAFRLPYPGLVTEIAPRPYAIVGTAEQTAMSTWSSSDRYEHRRKPLCAFHD
jgi:hypothetical protein